MEQKKLKKLVLKKETISNLSNFEQSRIVGGYDAGTWDYFEEYMTGVISHFNHNDCINGHKNTDKSFCFCTNNQNTCQCFTKDITCNDFITCKETKCDDLTCTNCA